MKFRLCVFAIVFASILGLSPEAMALKATEPQKVITEDISRQQMEAQITFFDAALNEFGASSADKAVKLWAKGDQTRNGVYKYSVSSDSLKNVFIERWGKPEKSFWIIGGSSPWLTSYTVLDKKNISTEEIVYTVQYNWATSAGPETPTREKLTVRNFGDKWCISKALELSGAH